MAITGSSKGAKEDGGFRRSLGVFDGVMILVGITIGAGIYSVPSSIAKLQDSFEFIMLLWLVAGAFALVGGLIYAELGSRLPNTGGEYIYITKAFGPTAGFIFGWAQLFIIRTSPAAALAIVVVNYFGHFVSLGEAVKTALCIVVILAIGAVNYVGVRKASAVQIATTIIKVGGLVALVVIGLLFVQGPDPTPASSDFELPDESRFGLFAATMLFIVFAYLGWDRVGYSAGEMKNPRRTIPISLLIGISAVVVIYGLANLVYYETLGLDGIRQSERVASDTATKLVGAWGASAVAIVVMISAAGSINGTMMTAPRAYYAMAHNGSFFRALDYIHPRFNTPSRAILVHCGWAIVILLVRRGFDDIVAGMAFAILIFYAMTTVALFKLRMDRVGNPSFKIPLLLPALYFIGITTLILMKLAFDWQGALRDLAFVLPGIPIAFVVMRFRRKTDPPAESDSSSEPSNELDSTSADESDP